MPASAPRHDRCARTSAPAPGLAPASGLAPAAGWRGRLAAGVVTATATLVLLSSGTSAATIGVQDGANCDGHHHASLNTAISDDAVVVRLTITDRSQFRWLSEAGADQWTHGQQLGPHEYLVERARIPALVEAGLDPVIVLENVRQRIEAERVRVVAANAQDGAGEGLAFFDDYRPLATVEQFTDALVVDHPDLVTKTTIGTSLEGRPISVLTIRGTGGDPGTRPAVAINAMQHAREWITIPTVVWFVDQLLDRYGSDDRVTEVLDAIDLHVIPVVNPDGYVYSWTDERLWRKNRRDNGDGTRGVDLNRNWGFEWGGPGSDGDTDSDIYRGPSPFSEPETQVLRDFIEMNPEIAAHLDVHSYSQLILWPFGYDFVEPEGVIGEVHADTGEDMADSIFAVNGFSYAPGPGHSLYLAAGICTDWVHGAFGALSWTFELRPASASGGGFILPADQIVPTATENYEAFLALAERVAAGVAWTFPSSLPAVVEPDTPATITVSAAPIAGAMLDPSTASIVFSIDGGPLEELALAPSGPETYTADLPATACGSSIAFGFRIESEDGVVYQDPPGGPEAFYMTDVLATVVRYENDFETTDDWTVVDEDLIDGEWERGVPAGDGDRRDPTEDFDGSGACWLTKNLAGNSDVDGGPTTLTSPRIDIGATTSPTLVFARWMSNDDQDLDRLETFVSADDGASWVLVESVGDQGDVWNRVEIPIGDIVGDATSVRVRFRVADQPNNSVTEAAIDAVAIVDRTCDLGTPQDLDGDGVVGLTDLLTLLSAWGPCSDCAADFDGDGSVGLTDLVSLLAVWS